ncbi:MAG: ATP-dependent zinc metalloprotease FtsH [Candidatus Magasanikbacteria bacterium]|jgi:cell division protease FtsH|nr:ATP-dependent zinc metalloprotease FtsH [Candidatus Magasanikbacteria bacterium]MBT4315187.1 ATP-dependent zinc metalloprotease FtsH [Candidatus Magasanikbacteria bacterium]MBT4547356.1 ATP-dependent zinc metalloprotease FtsH [Candidatus Magasanikbacteria bacterium]MBT6819042.1 ATP-dependent zinc metalloprotease FtsH [Candidatus Magasanikbacteria bacterium]
MKNLIKNFSIIFIVLLTFAAILSFTYSGDVEPEKVGVNRLIQNINEERVIEVEVRGDFLLATLKGEEEKVLEVKKEPGQSFAELMSDYGVESEKLQKVNLLVKEESGFTYWMTLILPAMLPILLIIGIIWFMSRQMQGMNNKAMGFGQSKAKQNKPDDKSKKTFKDVAGAKEAKEELNEVVDFLKNPKKFTEMGAKIPKGLLLMGSPGTGKTLLAKAVAGEADVPFFHISGSEFVEMFVGVGASRVRDLFDKAKKAAPSIIFIDEIDAVARKRGAGLGGSHDEREQTLNQILVEMDGFDPNLGVIVVAATNRPDVLDPALLRPGRFDRRVVIDMPDIEDREQILKVHAKGKPLTKGVSLRKVAERTPGFSGADLANLLNEAAIMAVRLGKKKIDEEEVLDSIEKVMLGPEKKSRVMSDQEREMTAYHEAGHAVVGHFLKNCDSVRKVSIIGRGMAGGYTLSMPEKEIRYSTIAKFKDDLAMILGGYMTEKIVYGDDQLSTGPSSDLKKATQMAKKMVMHYGMSDKLGPRMYADNEGLIFLAQDIHEKKNYSEKTAEMIDEEINELLNNALVTAKEVIKTNKNKMDDLVKVLLEKETVEQDVFSKIMSGSAEAMPDKVEAEK